MGAPSTAYQAVWTGKRVLVLDGPRAAYDPATDTWEPLADPPDACSYAFTPNIVAWDGCRVIMLGVVGSPTYPVQAWVYEPPSP